MPPTSRPLVDRVTPRISPAIGVVALAWGLVAVVPVVSLAQSVDGLVLMMAGWNALPMLLAWLFAPREEDAGWPTGIHATVLGICAVLHARGHWLAFYSPDRRPDGQAAFAFVVLPIIALIPVCISVGFCNLLVVRRRFATTGSLEATTLFWIACLVGGIAAAFWFSTIGG